MLFWQIERKESAETADDANDLDRTKFSNAKAFENQPKSHTPGARIGLRNSLDYACFVSSWVSPSGSKSASGPRAQVPSLPPLPKPRPAPAPTLPSFTQEELQGMQAVLETSRGQIVLEFYARFGAVTCEILCGLVKTGFYDGTTFHRVILRGIIQGGDPLSKDPTKKSLYGTGG